MKFAALLASAVLLGSTPSYAFSPADFLGTWIVRQVAGASNVVSSTNPRKLLGTKLHWTDKEVTDAEGVCVFGHASLAPIGNDQLEGFLWGGQKINGLEIPKRTRRSAFGKQSTEVYYDGGQGCVEAVMLNRDSILFMFHNGYLYKLERVRHP